MSLARYALIFSAVFSLVANGPLAVMAAAHTDPAAALMEAGDELTGQDRGGRPHGGPRAADDEDGKKDADEKEGRGDGPGRSREDDEDGPGRGRRGSQRAISGLVSAVATDTFTVDSVVIKVDGNTRYQRPGQGRDKPDFGDVTSGVKVHVLAVRIVPASASGPQWLARKVQLPRTRLKFAHWIGTINTITNLGSIKIIDRDGAEHEAVIDAQSRQLPIGATFAAGDRVLIHAMRGDDGKWVALLLVKLGPPNPGGTPTPAPAPDASVPTVTGVDSPTANGSYGAGGSIRVAVAFSEAVTVIGAPQITLETGGSDAGANYFSGSGTNTLTFVYNVAAGQASNDLDYASTSALTLPAGAAIRDAAGNNAVLTLPVMGQPGSLGANKAIVINTSTDATSPSVVSVSSTASDGIYASGASIPVTVTFSENVDVVGTPQLTLETGVNDAVLNYGIGSGSPTLTFTYVVASGHATSDLDYVSSAALNFNNGTIKDSTGNPAVLTLPALGQPGSLGLSKAIVIDTTAPTVAGVSSTKDNGTYGTGAVIPVTVTFTENVMVTGVPQLTLKTGDALTAVLSYGSGSGTPVLAFTYTVAAGQSSADLDYVSTSALLLNSGTINDAAGNAAVLALAAPGAANSLAANKQIAIDTAAADTAAPTVTGVSSTTADGPYGTSAPLRSPSRSARTWWSPGPPNSNLRQARPMRRRITRADPALRS